jgi:hypothetical protein
VNSLRNILLLVLISLPACTPQQREANACRAFAAYDSLPAPPENVESLYALTGFGRPEPRYHEHWYRIRDNTLAACRPIKADRTGCGTQEIEFVKTMDGWEISKPMVVIICASRASAAPPASPIERPDGTENARQPTERGP